MPQSHIFSQFITNKLPLLYSIILRSSIMIYKSAFQRLKDVIIYYNNFYISPIVPVICTIVNPYWLAFEPRVCFLPWADRPQFWLKWNPLVLSIVFNYLHNFYILPNCPRNMYHCKPVLASIWTSSVLFAVSRPSLVYDSNGTH